MAKRVFIEESKTQTHENPEAHLEQIRTILFGQQMLTIEQKLQGLEQRTTELNQELLDRIASLEDRLAGLLRQEAEERQIADQALQGSLDTAVDNLEDKLASETKEIRAELKDQGRELNKKLDQVASSLQAAIEELRLHKTDRKVLANLLASMADSLQKD
ncbi:MAG: hypothetical protein KatS3mg070_0446 [Meiothermus sp.]|uniref:hypothetical protein n=1 Tax=Meiothermus sp. TaxID=1955249 RepID=UPI0021DC4036|nr:hypothetical protein [Meiothermus sp.]GIW27083.1 MAG: hypothetical protein KatS3mg070_0446 [Meiothermus sp.]